MQVTLGYVFGQCFPNWQQVYKCQLHFHCKSSAPGVLCLVFGPCPSTAEVETKPPPRGVIPFFLFTSLSSQKLSILPSRCLNMRHSTHLTSPARAKRADNLILFFRVYWMNSNWHRFTSSRKFTYRMPWHLRQRQPFFWSQKQKKKKFTTSNNKNTFQDWIVDPPLAEPHQALTLSVLDNVTQALGVHGENPGSPRKQGVLSNGSPHISGQQYLVRSQQLEVIHK